MEVMFEFGLFPTVEAPGEARRRLAQLEPRLDEDSLSAVRAVVSELVTISVAHGASEPIDAKLTLFDDQIEGVVEDHGPGTRAIVRAKKHRDSPLVLRIIDGLVREWGTDQKQTRVWFRMPIRRLG
jgi:anti-sigma regulatory factor (Ser/Thr protein kinase)